MSTPSLQQKQNARAGSASYVLSNKFIVLPASTTPTYVAIYFTSAHMRMLVHQRSREISLPPSHTSRMPEQKKETLLDVLDHKIHQKLATDAIGVSFHAQ